MPRPDIQRRNYTMSSALHERTLAASAVLSQNMSYYTRTAVSILGYASAHGFSPRTTQLVLADKQRIHIPSLAPASDERSQTEERLNLLMPLDELQSLQAFAELSGTTEAERVRRALRFRNFLTEQCGIEHPTLQYQDAMPVVLIN